MPTPHDKETTVFSMTLESNLSAISNNSDTGDISVQSTPAKAPIDADPRATLSPGANSSFEADALANLALRDALQSHSTNAASPAQPIPLAEKDSLLNSTSSTRAKPVDPLASSQLNDSLLDVTQFLANPSVDPLQSAASDSQEAENLSTDVQNNFIRMFPHNTNDSQISQTTDPSYDSLLNSRENIDPLQSPTPSHSIEQDKDKSLTASPSELNESGQNSFQPAKPNEPILSVENIPENNEASFISRNKFTFILGFAGLLGGAAAAYFIVGITFVMTVEAIALFAAKFGGITLAGSLAGSLLGAALDWAIGGKKLNAIDHATIASDLLSENALSHEERDSTASHENTLKADANLPQTQATTTPSKEKNDLNVSGSRYSFQKQQGNGAINQALVVAEGDVVDNKPRMI